MIESYVLNGLLLLVLILYVIAVEIEDLLYSVILLAGGSVGLSVVFYILHAPDLAITQAAVGAGISTVLLVNAIYQTRRTE